MAKLLAFTLLVSTSSSSCADDPDGACFAMTSMLQRQIAQGSLKAERSLVFSGSSSLAGAMAQAALQRLGLRIGSVAGEPERVQRLMEGKEQVFEQCPGLMEATVVDSARDEEGADHWILRSPTQSLLLHVRSGETGLHVVNHKSLACRASDDPNSGILEDDELAGAEAPVNVVTNPRVTKSKAYLDSEVSEKLAACGDNTNYTVQVLSATAQMTSGVVINMSVALQPTNPDPQYITRYHSIAVNWIVNLNSIGEELLPTAILPTDASGAQLPWCDLSTMSTSAALSLLAEREGHDKVLEYHMKLGYLGFNSDAGPNPDSLLQVGAAPNCSGVNNLPKEWSMFTSAYKGCVGPVNVMNQHSCGSCWAFSSATASTTRACMQPGGPELTQNGSLQISPQSALSCNVKQLGCNGGYMSGAQNTWLSGAPLLQDYPYNPNPNAWPWSSLGQYCQWGLLPQPYITTQVYKPAANMLAMQQEVYCNGPFTVTFTVYQNFYNYVGGVYNSTDSSSVIGGHAVTLMGWGLWFDDSSFDLDELYYRGGDTSSADGSETTTTTTTTTQDPDTGMPYWLIQNSWGSGWALDGYFLFLRGQNFCGIEKQTTAASVSINNFSWQYTDWGPCQADNSSTGTQTRGLQCIANADNTTADNSSCVTSNGWPNVDTFPNLTFGISNNISQESPPMAATSCSVPFVNSSGVVVCADSMCNGNGIGVPVNNSNTSCQCQCATGYTGLACDSCNVLYIGYPTCRLMCTRTGDCSGNGMASGVRWVQDSVTKDSCSCICDEGYSGANCSGQIRLMDMANVEEMLYPTWSSNVTMVDSFPFMLGHTNHDLGLSGNSFTVMSWIRLDDDSKINYAVLGNPVWNTRNCLEIGVQNGRLYMGFAGPFTCLGNTTFEIHAWHTAAWKYDVMSETMSIYLNGQLDGQCEGALSLLGSEELTIGMWAGQNKWVGGINKLEIYQLPVPESLIEAKAFELEAFMSSGGLVGQSVNVSTQ